MHANFCSSYKASQHQGNVKLTPLTLPAEVRNKIWRLYVDSTRGGGSTYINFCDGTGWNFQGRNVHGRVDTGRCTELNLLMVCQQTRIETRNLYTVKELRPRTARCFERCSSFLGEDACAAFRGSEVGIPSSWIVGIATPLAERENMCQASKETAIISEAARALL